MIEPKSTTSNPLDHLPMTIWQILVVAITVALNALDGFDVLSISFASPGIAKEWGIDRAALGIVLSSELLGMAVGSVALGWVGDRIGRLPTTLFSLFLMASGMAMVSSVHSIALLCGWRIFTGIGIGGMLAVTNAIAAEMTNLRRRSLCVSLMVIGYPIGAILGGMVSSHLLLTHDWRAIFTFGALCTTIVMPIVLLIMPETPAYIIAKRAPDAVDRLNRSLRKLGHFAEKTLPPITERPQTNLFSLFAPALRRNTILLTSAYFAQIITFYFILKWTPKIVTDMGFHPSTAGGILVWANVGGALGGALFGLATQYFPLKKVSLCALAASAIMVTVFGQTSANLTTLALLAGLGGFCTNAAMVGLYNLAASAFPTDLRATGTGFAIGIGRGGAALGPWIVGLLFQSGLGLPVVAAIIASGSIAAFCAIAGLRLLPTSPP